MDLIFATTTLKSYFWQCPCSPGGGEVLRMSSDGGDRLEARIRTRKIPGPRINPQKNPMPNIGAKKLSRNDCPLFAELRRPGYVPLPQSSDCFEYPKSPYLNQVIHTQKIIGKLSYRKKKISGTGKTSNHKLFFDHPFTWNQHELFGHTLSNVVWGSQKNRTIIIITPQGREGGGESPVNMTFNGYTQLLPWLGTTVRTVTIPFTYVLYFE